MGDIHSVPHWEQKTEGVTIQDLTATVNWRPGFVHPCPMVYYRVQTRPPSDPILCQLNPVYTRTLDFYALCLRFYCPAIKIHCSPKTTYDTSQRDTPMRCHVVNSEPKFQAAEPALVGHHHSFFRQYGYWRHFPRQRDVSSNRDVRQSYAHDST
jgi:hypothetical protein